MWLVLLLLQDPGILANDSMGFVLGPKTGIDAIDLKTGQVLWHTDDAALPLAISGSQLIAQVDVRPNVIQLAAIEKGRLLRQSDSIEFPDWVSVTPGGGLSFSARLEIRGDLAELAWEAHSRYFGGVAPTPEIMERCKRDAAGLFKIDLKSDKVEAGRAEEQNDRFTLVTSGGYQNQTLSLKECDRSGKELRTVELLSGPSLCPQISRDRKFVFVTKGVPKESLPEGDYAWWIFSLETAKQVGKVPFDPDTSPVEFTGKQFFSVGQLPGKMGDKEIQRILKAWYAASGKLLWTRALRPLPNLQPPP
jgi:hypothetical protein